MTTERTGRVMVMAMAAALLGWTTGCNTPPGVGADGGTDSGVSDAGAGTDGGAVDGGGGSDSGTDAGSDAGSDGGVSHRCLNYSPLRNLYWGDLHVHTQYSLDASGYGTPTTPLGAYRFGQGQTINLAPNANGPRTATIDRSLDFLGVTDHSEHLGKTPDSGNTQQGAWDNELAAATLANDTSANCAFTSLKAYEWTGLKGATWIHRNVVFGTDVVPTLPADSVVYPTPQQLWAQLDATCLRDAGCEVTVIPHNANYTKGLQYLVPDTITPLEAATRANYERLTEVYQSKGNSECKLGVDGTTDALCEFSQQFQVDCTVPQADGGPKPDCTYGSYVRSGLRHGLHVQNAMGVNPLKMGIVGATDTHNASPGDVAKYTYQGHAGKTDGDVLTRLDPTQKYAFQDPGGITGVWAEQNDRANIFQALQRRETFATSGPRIQVRFFGGWGLPSGLCSQTDLVAVAYDAGVPMGADLPARTASAPNFVVWAQKDPGVTGHAGVGLQRLQIVKGWVDPGTGTTFEQVYDVAGTANDGSTVDMNTCATTGGNASLCAVWSDPSFSPSQLAFYYVRVLEEPSCTAHQYDCNSLPGVQRPASCGVDGGITLVDQDRAWTSPIWYGP